MTEIPILTQAKATLDGLNFTELGFLTVNSTGIRAPHDGFTQEANDFIRVEAKKLRADAVIIISYSTAARIGFIGSESGTTVTAFGMAIKYLD